METKTEDTVPLAGRDTKNTKSKSRNKSLEKDKHWF